MAIVSSGDAGIFGMAAAVLEVAEEGRLDGIDVLVLAGLSAMQAVAARVGAPLGHDFCVISLSDRLKERLRQAGRFDGRTREFLDQKIEGVVEAPLGICVCCDHGEPGVEVLGRGTIPETDVYSTACAIENRWLAARAEGLGVGWVSCYRPEDLRRVLGIPTGSTRSPTCASAGRTSVRRGRGPRRPAGRRGSRSERS